MPAGQEQSQSFADKLTSIVTKTNPFVALRDSLRANSENKIDNPAAQPKAPVIQSSGIKYKSLSELQATGFAKDQKSQQFAAARNLKDVTKAPNPQLKMQAVSGKIDRVVNSDEFRQLDVSKRTYVLSHYYDKFVAPTLKENGIEPPEKADWIKGYGRTVGTDETKPTASSTGTFTSAAISSQADMARLTANVFKYVTKLGPPNAVVEKSPVYTKLLSYADKMQKVSTDYDSTFETRHDASGWLSNFAGHIVGDAPAYMAAGELVPSLAEKAALSKGFKVAYSSLKAAGEVFSVNAAEGKGLKESAIDAGTALLLGSGVHAAALKFGSAKLAAGGELFANKVAHDADHIEPITEATSVNKPKALVNPNDPDYKQAVNNERFLREHFAQEFHPDKAEAAGGKSTWRNLSSQQRTKIKDHISALTKQSAELMPLVNPEVQTQANSVLITREALSNPAFGKRMQAIEAMTGLKVAEVLTKVQADEVKRSTGLGSPAHILDQSFAQGDMFGENISRTKGLATVSNKGITNPLLPEDAFLEKTQKYLEKNAATKSGHDYFENPEHHLLWVANHSDAPASVKQSAFMRLRRDYNVSQTEAVKKGQWLAEHVSDLRDTGKLETEGNIFRSTKTTQRRYGTEWQHQLYEGDLLKSDLEDLKKLTRAKPELKQPVEEILQALNNLRNKAQTPLTSRLRRMKQKEVIDILGEYK